MKRKRISIAILAGALVGSVLLVSSQRVAKQPLEEISTPVSQSADPGKGLGRYLTIAITTDQRSRGVAEAKRAVTLSSDRQDQAALQAYDRATAIIPNLGDWLAMFSAGVAATTGDTAQVNRRLADLDSAFLQDWAWRTRVRAYRNAKDLTGAIQLAQVFATTPGSVRRRSEAFRTIGEIRLEQNDTAQAKTAFTESMDVFPNSDIALESARLLSELRGLDPQQQLRIGRVYLAFGNRERGVRGVQAYLRSHDAHPDTSARVRLELGRFHFSEGQYRDANRVLVDLADSAAPAIASEALFLGGRAQYRLDRVREGRQTLLNVAARFPQHDVAARALYMLGDLDHDANNRQRATNFYRQAIATRPGSEAGGVSYMRLALMALTSGQPSEAVRILDEYRTAYPRGVRHQQASYWTGRTYLALGNQTAAAERLNEARALDPFTSYGVMAARQLKQPVIDSLAPDPVTPEHTSAAVSAALQRLTMLDEIGWPEAAAFELQRIRRYFAHDTAALFALAEGLNRSQRVVSGIALGKELQAGQPMSRRLLRILYPLPYQELIVPAARQHGLDPYFMAALIRQESAFNPRATSGVGAMGLMQVMPSTGRSVARRLGIRRFTRTMLHDAAVNVRIGAQHLADVFREWRGRPDYVLAAYNAGSTRVQRWRHFDEARDPELFMERIPFDETRDYVRVVQLNARIYEALYGSGVSTTSGGN